MKCCLSSGTLVTLELLLLAVCASYGSAINQLTPREHADGWKLLFDGSTIQGWHSFKQSQAPSKGWIVEDGWLHCQGSGGGDLLSHAEFDEFDLRWEWKIEAAGNSGVKYFVPEEGNSAIGHEYQMLDDERNPDAKLADGKRITASFYDVLRPTAKIPIKPIGEINESRILVKGDHVEHWLNGMKVLEYQCGSPALKSAVAESKFKGHPRFGDRLKGHILLQDHHSQVWFRNLKIRDLSGK